MGVLVHFFQISLVISMCMFVANGSIIVFGQALTGQDPIGVTDLNISSYINTNASQISSESTISSTPTFNPNDITTIRNFVIIMLGGVESVLLSIFSSYGMSNIIGYLIIAPLVAIKLIGIGYLLLAIIGTPLGGSTP